jgi:hypothetical protein
MQLKQSIESYLACSPKATTRWLNKTCLEMSAPSGANIREGHDDVLCAVIPFATRKQAAATVKWANLTEEQKVERLAKALSRTHGRLFGSPEDWKKQLEQKRIAWRNYAAACIRAMEEAT